MYFNCVINCEFPADLKPEAVEILRYITTPEYKFPEDIDFENIFPVSEIKADLNLWSRQQPDMARFVTFTDRDGRILSYALQYVGYLIHDDTFANDHSLLLIWIAQYCIPGFIGYFGESVGELGFSVPVTLFTVKDGQLHSGKFDISKGTFEALNPAPPYSEL